MAEFKLVVISNRHFFSTADEFLSHMEKLAAAHPDLVILREKDLTPAAYAGLAEAVLDICGKHRVTCALHGFVETARALKAPAFHAPMPVLADMSEEDRRGFLELGASTHSLEQARRAAAAGCTYITASHIYETDCKKGLPGRGTAFLKAVCDEVSLPVYALGGINASKIEAVKAAGAAGACFMSSAMTCPDPRQYIGTLRHFAEK
ncbi:MAG: thiamine phosphate synthase [Pseudoramibacter sp.]